MKYDYDCIVIGSGAAGLVASKTISGFGKKTALVEKDKLGGSCTYTGCVPSKALIKAAKVVYTLARQKDFGLDFGNAVFNKDRVMDSVRQVLDKISASYTPAYFNKLGIGILTGEAKFIDNHEIEISGRRVSSAKFIIATGSSPAIPLIPGIKETPYLTSENLFNLKKIPGSLAVLGGGPIGIEMAQAFRRLGAEVTVLEMEPRILIREDTEIAQALTGFLKSEGVEILTGARVIRMSQVNGKVFLSIVSENKERKLPSFDYVLISSGRQPNTALNLDKAGVKFNIKGITVNNNLKTSADNIFACGDVVGPFLFSHMAEYQAVIASVNASLPLKRKANYDNVIWTTFCDPELARMGLTEEEARIKYKNKIKVYRTYYNSLDSALTDREEKGMAKFILSQNYKLLGCHILGHNAGEAIIQPQLSKTFRIPFTKLQSAIYPYPAYSEIIRTASKKAYIDKLQGHFIVRFLRCFFSKSS
ncbi:MAG: hypothetical protein A3J83_08630 [Elusimicrobia bacterium RIFOXYA2_FULL_40_6]|nr:MAG: hypothetical protein A3J83_08630 [Elusimicrobia bacterium RIFOXYA2_FULL_40_6]